MPGDDQFVEVYGLLLGHPVETEVVEDEQVRGEEGAEGLVGGVVHMSGFERQKFLMLYEGTN